jgi:hypothetical protein
MQRRLSSSCFNITPKLLALQIALLALALSFMGCAALPDATQLSGALPASALEESKGVSAHELGLLRILADELQEQERRGAYDELYDGRASRSLKAGLPRPQFLEMTRCLERHLGELKTMTPGSLRIEALSPEAGTYALHYKATRSGALVETDVRLMRQGFAYQLQGLQWQVLGKASHANFDTCITSAIKGQPDPSLAVPEEEEKQPL